MGDDPIQTSDGVWPRLAPAVAIATALVAIVALAMTVAEQLPLSVRSLVAERERYERVSRSDRERTFGTAIPVPMDILDFYRRNLRRDDRYFVQITNSAFGQFADKKTVVRNVARYYLAPAIEVERPDEADVILSFDADPGLLPFEYSEQVRAGLQLIFVSRIER